MVALASGAFRPSAEKGEAAVRRAVYRAGTELARDGVLIAWAGELALEPHRAGRSQEWTALLETAMSWVPPVFPLGGGDVTALGVPAGPSVGRLLRAVEAWWDEGDFAADRAACLERLAPPARPRLTARRQGRYAHQDGLDVAAGLQSEQRAAVVEQVELDIAAALGQLASRSASVQDVAAWRRTIADRRRGRPAPRPG